MEGSGDLEGSGDYLEGLGDILLNDGNEVCILPRLKCLVSSGSMY